MDRLADRTRSPHGLARSREALLACSTARAAVVRIVIEYDARTAAHRRVVIAGQAARGVAVDPLLVVARWRGVRRAAGRSARAASTGAIRTALTGGAGRRAARSGIDPAHPPNVGSARVAVGRRQPVGR